MVWSNPQPPTNGWTKPAPPTSGWSVARFLSVILTEDGFDLLQENGSLILLEGSALSDIWDVKGPPIPLRSVENG
jgi:hypothetical protein